MPKTIPKPCHRERTPPRLCESCHAAWLTSFNEDPWCYQCGGWTTQRMSPVEAISEIPSVKLHQDRRADVGEALEEMLA